MSLFPNKRILLNTTITLCITILLGSSMVPMLTHTAPSKNKMSNGATHKENVNFKELLANDPEFQKEYQKMSPTEREQINQLTQELETISKDPKKLAEFEKNLERTMKDMDEALNKIGGEDALNNMSEDELTDFIMNFTAEQDAKQKNQKKQVVPQKPKPAPKQSASSLTEKDILLENIKAIIQHINLFLIKTSSMHELPEKIESWSKSGLLPEWGKTATWNKIKNHIELLQSKLTYIIVINPTTKKRPYLDYIYEDKALSSLIQLLKTKLVEYEPKITVTSFELGDELSRSENKATNSTQNPTQQLINSFGDALQKLTMNESINKAIEKYEPLAKEMREAEEKFLKSAEAAAKKKPMIPRSTPTKHSFPASGASGYKPDQKGYYPSSSGNYGSPRSASRRSSRSAYQGPYYDSNVSDGARSSAPAKADAYKEKESKDQKDKKTTPSDHDKKINKLLNSFEGEMENIAEINNKGSVASTLASSKATQIPTRLTLKTEGSLKEMMDSLKIATAAADDLYNSVDNPQSHMQTIQAAMRSIAPFMNAVEKLYNADIYDAQIEKARAHSFPVEDAWKAAEKEKIAAEKELAELSVIASPATAAEIQAAQQNVDQAQSTHDKAKRVWEAENDLVVAAQTAKEVAIPADVANMLTEYKKLQKKAAQFSKRPRNRRPVAHITPNTNAATQSPSTTA